GRVALPSLAKLFVPDPFRESQNLRRKPAATFLLGRWRALASLSVASACHLGIADELVQLLRINSQEEPDQKDNQRAESTDRNRGWPHAAPIFNILALLAFYPVHDALPRCQILSMKWRSRSTGSRSEHVAAYEPLFGRRPPL